MSVNMMETRQALNFLLMEVPFVSHAAEVVIRPIHFTINTSLCNCMSNMCECARDKRYCCCCAHDDGVGHLAENNGDFTVKHISLISSSHTGRA